MSGSREPWRLPVADAAPVRQGILALIKADWRAMALVLLLTGLAAVAGLAGPWLLGRIVTRIENGDATTSAVDQLALGGLLCAISQLVLTRFALNRSHRFGERALARLREEVVSRALALPARVVEQVSSGDLVTRCTVDVGTVATTLRSAVPDVFIAAVQVLFIFAAVFLLHPLLGLFALVGMPLVWWVTRWYLVRARTAYLAAGEAASEVAEVVASTAQGARTVEAFGLRERRVRDADRAIDQSYRAARRTLFLRSVLFPVTEFAHSLPVAVTLLVGGYAYIDGSIGLGVVVAGSLYMWQLVDPLDRILMWVEQLQSSGASLARIKGVGLVAGDRRTDVPEPGDDRIKVRGVDYAYVAGRDVLKDVHLTVRPGERLAVVGPSGAGKTTLGKLLSGADAPREGSVLVGGVPVADLAAADELGNRIVLVTQDHHVFIGTLRDNLTMAAPHADDARLHAALALVGADWAEDLPDGMDTEVGSGSVVLDPAQAQQLSLARVELADPHTLILDEATALLDPATARHAERAMAAVRADRTVIAIAHRLQTAHDADRVAVVDDGRIVELDTHDKLIAADGPYAALWRSWHGRSDTDNEGPTG
ncbi:ABC transporter ATP-binding protein [Streptomyces sp. LZ34]